MRDSLLLLYQNYVSAVCLYQTYVRVLICCCPSQLIIAITSLYQRAVQDSNIYITSSIGKCVSHHIEYNRWAGHSTTSACISYTRTVCAAPAKQHRHIHLHARPHASTHPRDGMYTMVCACAESIKMASFLQRPFQ